VTGEWRGDRRKRGLEKRKKPAEGQEGGKKNGIVVRQTGRARGPTGREKRTKADPVERKNEGFY